MTPDEFWSIIAAARAGTEPGSSVAGAVIEQLAAAGPESILDYEQHVQEASDRLYRWDVWAAAYLIGGGCSDDRFGDFRAGVVSLGSEWYERVKRSPDELAQYEPVRRAAETGDETIFDEEFLTAAIRAYEQISGDDEEFYDAYERHLAESGRPPAATDMGDEFDFDDAVKMRRRLPQLSALYARAESRRPASPDAGTDTPRTVQTRHVRYEDGLAVVETVENVPVSGRMTPEDMQAMIAALKGPAVPPTAN